MSDQLSYWPERLDLAVALRWAAKLDLNEGVDNHFSLAVGDDRFLINPFGWHWSEITASSLVLCDARGQVLEGDNEVEDTAFYIHSSIHNKVPGATAVLHTHMPYATSLTLLEQGRLEMCEQNALAFYDRIAYDDEYGGLALDQDEGERIAAAMGSAGILFMAGHGITVTGPDVRRAFTDLYYLERACMFQVLARSGGQPLRTLGDNAVKKTAAQMVDEMPRVADRYFTALRRMLTKESPEFAS